MTGTVPPQLGTLTNLQQLHLNDNQLTGPIPPELAALTYLHHLDLSNNALTGPIPPELGTLAKLRWLYLGSNQLTGPIPPQLGALQGLQVLSLNNNQLSGAIPPQLDALRGLKVLDVSDNHLSGPIPTELSTFTQLGLLYLSSNALTGCLPPALRVVRDNDFVELGLPACGFEDIPEIVPAPTVEIGAEYIAQCSNGIVVHNPQQNSGLVADCAALLQSRGTLPGRIILNWNVDRAIDDWQGSWHRRLTSPGDQAGPVPASAGGIHPAPAGGALTPTAVVLQQ